MATNGSEIFLDRATRIRKIQQIAQFIASIENKDPQDQHLHNLAQKFEHLIFSAAMNVEDYNNMIHKKLTTVQKVRQQQAAAVQAMQGTQSLEQARLRQQQQQQQQALQQRWLAPHQRQPHQQVTGGCFLQQQGLPIQSPTATSGASTPGAAAAAVTVVWPNQPYTSPDSTIYSVPGTSSVGGWGSRGPGGAYEGQAGNALVSNASQMGQGVDAAAQAAANMVASAAMGIPRQAAPVGPGSRGIGRNVSSVMAMQTGHGSGSAQIQVDAEDRAKQHRSLRVEELRNIYQEDILYFVQHVSRLLTKLYKTKPDSKNSEQVLPLVQYVKEGHNALLYIERCHDTGHVPSAASLNALEHTLIRVHKACIALKQRQAATVQAILGTQSLEQAGLHQQQQVTGSSLLQQQGLPIQTSTASIPGAAAAASVTAAWPNQPYSTMNSVPGISSVDGQGSRGPGGAYGGQAGNAMVSNASQMGQGVDVAAQLAANVFAFASMDIERNMSSATVLQTGHGSGSAQNQVDAKDRTKQERRW